MAIKCHSNICKVNKMKLQALLAAMAIATAANAETLNEASLSEEAAVNDKMEFTAFKETVPKEVDITTISTDQGHLEHKKPLVSPAAKDGHDAGYWAQAVGSRIKLLGYAQAGYTANFVQDGENTNTFDMKRAVLMMSVDINPQFYAFFMHEFKSGAIQEYYMEYRPCKEFRVRFGQSKIELSIANPMSPRVLESINCSPQAVAWLCGKDPLMGNASGRDMGLMIYGDLFKSRLRYVFEVVNGGQINTADQNTQKNVIGKLEYQPVKNFRISVSGQLGTGCSVYDEVANKKPATYNPTIVKGQNYRQDRWAAGFEWLSSVNGNDWFMHRCASVRAEALGGRDGDVHSFGAYIASTVPVYKRLDVVGQVDYFNYNTCMGAKQTDLTAGLQYWIHTKLRLQAQYTHSLLSSARKAGEGHGNVGAIMTQIQFSF